MTELASTGALRATMGAYYGALADATLRKTAPVAWCTSVGPAELLRALGFAVHFPENHAAMLGASRTANRYLPLAHAQGYSQDICSYLTSDIGAYLAGESPLKAYGHRAGSHGPTCWCSTRTSAGTCATGSSGTGVN